MRRARSGGVAVSLGPPARRATMLTCSSTLVGYFAVSATLAANHGQLPQAGTRPAGIATFGCHAESVGRAGGAEVCASGPASLRHARLQWQRPRADQTRHLMDHPPPPVADDGAEQPEHLQP